MSEELLVVNQLHASVDDKEILHGIDLSVKSNETHVIMGPNGAGKSTLGSVLMGDPMYTIDKGTISLAGEDITGLSTDKIAKKGMFLSFQNPIEVPGITLSNFIRTAIEALIWFKLATTHAPRITKSYTEKKNDTYYRNNGLRWS